MSRRLVMLGHKKAKFHTTTVKIDNRFGEEATVVAERLPAWFPKPAPKWDEVDHDFLRKREIEDAIAKGSDL